MWDIELFQHFYFWYLSEISNVNPQNEGQLWRVASSWFRRQHFNGTFLVWLGTQPELQGLGLRSNNLCRSIKNFKNWKYVSPTSNCRSILQYLFGKLTNEFVPTFESYEVSWLGKEITKISRRRKLPSLDSSCNQGSWAWILS